MGRLSPLLLLMTVLAASQTPCLSASLQSSIMEGLSQLLEKEFKDFRYCPPPYTSILGECFYIHRYVPQLTWQQAQDFCKEAGGIGAEPKHFASIFAHLSTTTRGEGVDDNLWLGGHRVENTTTFEWVTSGQSVEVSVKGSETRRQEESYDSYFGGLSGWNDCLAMSTGRREPPHLVAKICQEPALYVCQLP